jgi:hypothetical protein
MGQIERSIRRGMTRTVVKGARRDALAWSAESGASLPARYSRNLRLSSVPLLGPLVRRRIARKLIAAES